MTTRSLPLLAVATASLLTGCESAPRQLPNLQLNEAARVVPPTPAGPAVSLQDVQLFAAPPRETLASYVRSDAGREAGFAGPEDAETFRSTAIHGYRPGVVYQIRTTPGFLTTVVFEKGEKITHLGSGDSDRWLFQEVLVGDEQNGESTILIKPSVAPLATNLVITTDRRLYQIEVIADETPDRYQSLVRWRYAGSALARRGLRWSEMGDRVGGEAAAAEEALPVNEVSVNLQNLDFSYDILVHKGKNPRWAPVSAFHDGSKTYLRFPRYFEQVEAPAVFSGNGEEDQIINFRVVDGMYVIDRVLDLAVLKLGKKKQDVIFVEYTGDFFNEENR